jgi:hypothetical protein
MTRERDLEMSDWMLICCRKLRVRASVPKSEDLFRFMNQDRLLTFLCCHTSNKEGGVGVK